MADCLMIYKDSAIRGYSTKEAGQRRGAGGEKGELFGYRTIRRSSEEIHESIQSLTKTANSIQPTPSSQVPGKSYVQADVLLKPPEYSWGQTVISTSHSPTGAEIGRYQTIQIYYCAIADLCVAIHPLCIFDVGVDILNSERAQRLRKRAGCTWATLSLVSTSVVFSLCPGNAIVLSQKSKLSWCGEHLPF